jgi:hypothetical protein
MISRRNHEITTATNVRSQRDQANTPSQTGRLLPRAVPAAPGGTGPLPRWPGDKRHPQEKDPDRNRHKRDLHHSSGRTSGNGLRVSWAHLVHGKMAVAEPPPNSTSGFFNREWKRMNANPAKAVRLSF